ncbi:hypothetical protein PENTCL1PPCAC_20501 [Pristionchus entomophagus]|uniref:G protein-coupled receptor n=1 Tax=Pristionchus entomophagus TaxID=358040 RepID=A0AAV5TV79_9BILA|nr:hypothetical protein PENTCL1PPCAC_20501 [Pristionchus entomophagus]
MEKHYLYLSLQVIRTLEVQRKSMSARTAGVHRTLIKIFFLKISQVLTLQSCLPAIFTLTIACYLTAKRGYHYPLIEHGIRVTTSLMTTISPYITILNIKVFRE